MGFMRGRTIAATLILLLAACSTETAQSETPTPDVTPTANATGSPTGTATPTATQTSTPTADPTSSPTAFGAALFDDPDDCSDDSVGYRVAFPDAWWWNEPFDSEIGPHAQCRYFAPEAFDATTVSREQPIPEGVAIFAIVIPPGDAGLALPGEAVTSAEVSVGGQPALVAEYEHAPGGPLAEGERVYRYVIELEDGRELAWITGNSTGDYDENRTVLDRMMESIELFEPGDVCGPEGDRFACGQIIVGLRGDATAPIEEVVERNSHGDSPTRIVERLDGINAYVLSVANGTEGDEISRYLLDDHVEYAELNGIGETAALNGSL